MQLTAAAVTPPAEHAARRPAGAAAADADVIYAEYRLDNYASMMHNHLHDNNTEHSGSPFEKGCPTYGHKREDFAGAYGA
jgi:hypothetical protein